MNSILDISCWIACPNLIWWNVLGYNTAGTNYGPFANGNSIANHNIATNENILFYFNFSKVVHPTFLIWVKKVGQNGCVLCYCHTFFNSYEMWRNTIKINIAVYPARTFYVNSSFFYKFPSLVSTQWQCICKPHKEYL